MSSPMTHPTVDKTIIVYKITDVNHDEEWYCREFEFKNGILGWIIECGKLIVEKEEMSEGMFIKLPEL